jgi:hypothetical protein
MKRRNFLEMTVLGATFYSCNPFEIGGKTISVGEDFFEKATCIDNGGQPLYIYNSNKKTIYLTPKGLRIERGKKIKNLTGLKLSTTSTTYEGNDIYNIEKLILSDSLKTK